MKTYQNPTLEAMYRVASNINNDQIKDKYKKTMLTYELKVIASQIPVKIIRTDGEELDNVHQEIKLPYGLITFDLTTRIYRNPDRVLTLSEGYSGVEYEPGEIDFEVDNVHLWDGRDRDLDLDDQSYWYLAETIKSKLIVQ